MKQMRKKIRIVPRDAQGEGDSPKGHLNLTKAEEKAFSQDTKPNEF
jgi:hypothetical protein